MQLRHSRRRCRCCGWWPGLVLVHQAPQSQSCIRWVRRTSEREGRPETMSTCAGWLHFRPHDRTRSACLERPFVVRSKGTSCVALRLEFRTSRPGCSARPISGQERCQNAVGRGCLTRARHPRIKARARTWPTGTPRGLGTSTSRGGELIAQGESLAHVQDQLGYASIQTTVDAYGHLVPGSNRNAVNRLDYPEELVLRLAPSVGA